METTKEKYESLLQEKDEIIAQLTKELNELGHDYEQLKENYNDLKREK